MQNKLFIIPILLILFSQFVIASGKLELNCNVDVPDKFKQDPPGWKPPNGEPESIRYTKAYEAFWWNCAMVKAGDIEDRCPFTCSGTPAASYGCSDGATDAENQIRDLLEDHDGNEVIKYLKTLAKDSAGLEKLKTYFPDGPQAEIISK